MPIAAVDPRPSELEDWQLLHHERPYDELLTEERHRFLRLRRQVIVSQELLITGLAALNPAARASGVPALVHGTQE